MSRMGALESSLNTATFVFEQDRVIRLVRRFQSPIVVDGRLFVAGDDALYAFVVR
jgi:hypothetical protein